MCGRFVSTSTIGDIADSLGVATVRTEPLALRYNVAPTDPVYAVAANRRDGGRALGTLRWGLVPSWAKDRSVGYKMINARAEGISERPAFRRALAKRRCIIPVDSYYEWQARTVSSARREAAAADRPTAEEAAPDSSAVLVARRTKLKQPKAPPKLPWAIHLADGSLMYMAGLWEVWRDPATGAGAEPLRSCTIVTTAANEALSAIHDRMPVILDAAGVEAWLDPTLQDPAEVRSLLRPAPPEWFAPHPVSTLVNKVGVDGPELLAPLPEPPAGVDLGLQLFR